MSLLPNCSGLSCDSSRSDNTVDVNNSEKLCELKTTNYDFYYIITDWIVERILTFLSAYQKEKRWEEILKQIPQWTCRTECLM